MTRPKNADRTASNRKNELSNQIEPNRQTLRNRNECMCYHIHIITIIIISINMSIIIIIIIITLATSSGRSECRALPAALSAPRLGHKDYSLMTKYGIYISCYVKNEILIIIITIIIITKIIIRVD